jgi:hypothetical protein
MKTELLKPLPKITKKDKIEYWKNRLNQLINEKQLLLIIPKKCDSGGN